MSRKSVIEWTNGTWNPVTGCTKVSTGCDHCYAERLSERFRGVEGHPFETGFDLTLRPARLEQPLRWRRPQLIFVNSMSDLFHKDIPTEYIHSVFDTMERADWHIYQVLTKRSSLMRRFVQERYPCGEAPSHIWLGVSIEDDRALTRSPATETDQRVRPLRLIRAPARRDGDGRPGRIFTGSLREGRADREPGRLRQSGYVICGINVRSSASPSSSSSGAGAPPKRAVIRWMGGSGWSIRKLSASCDPVNRYVQRARPSKMKTSRWMLVPGCSRIRIYFPVATDIQRAPKRRGHSASKERSKLGQYLKNDKRLVLLYEHYDVLFG